MKKITTNLQLDLFSDNDFDVPTSETQKSDATALIPKVVRTKPESPKEPAVKTQTPQRHYDHSALFLRLAQSKFRSGFHLKSKDIAYIQNKGLEVIRQHAADFVAKRLAPAIIPNDGKQTPMRGHPVFLAQHATACCCRECFAKWHHIPAGRALTPQEQEYAVSVLMSWIEKEYTK